MGFPLPASNEPVVVLGARTELMWRAGLKWWREDNLGSGRRPRRASGGNDSESGGRIAADGPRGLLLRY